MRALFIAMAGVLLTAYSDPKDAERARIMEEVDRHVQLPAGAHALGDYARYYAPGETGEIVAVYIVPFSEPARGTDVGCEELSMDMTSRVVPCPPPAAEAFHGVRAGEQLWLEDFRELPTVNNGGCNVIFVRFDPRSNTSTRADCQTVP